MKNSNKQVVKEEAISASSFNCPQCGNTLIKAKVFKGNMYRRGRFRLVCNDCGHEETRVTGEVMKVVTDQDLAFYKTTISYQNPYKGNIE